MSVRVTWLASLAIVGASHSAQAAEPNSIAINRSWDELTVPEGELDHRALFKQAGTKLGTWSVTLDGLAINGRRLTDIAAFSSGEPFLRVAREMLRRPLDLDDFLYFIDDVLAAGKKGLRGNQVWVPASRARAAGIFIHPDDVFLDNQPRLYGVDRDSLQIDRPKRLARLPPAKDGEILGPRWCSRFPNPSGRRAKLRALDRNPSGTFGSRVQLLMQQLKNHGAAVLLYSTVRDRRRGYLMWGAYLLSRLESKEEVERESQRLIDLNAEWGLNIPIRWRHPDGWRATIEAARTMADTYMVAYATENGAKNSSHYEATAVDLNVFGLPRTVELQAPDGTSRAFDLSDPNETRDLSLSPQLIDWVEAHFQLQKLKQDYPHWNDAALPAAADTPVPSAKPQPE